VLEVSKHENVWLHHSLQSFEAEIGNSGFQW